MSVWGSEGHHWACLMLPGYPGLLLAARECWWCYSCQDPALEPLRALSSHHGQTICTGKQDDCLLALQVWHLWHLNSVLTWTPVTCPCMGEDGGKQLGCLVSSPKCSKFSVGKRQALIITSSLLWSRRSKLLLSCNCESPLWMVAQGRQGWWCNS